MDHIDSLVIGAGVVGLAIAAKLSKNQSVVVIEQEQYFGEHSSSRNSEVIHAGLYYPTNSLKAKLCVRGKQLLYAHCQKYKVAHQRIGKLLLAQSAQEAQKLEQIKQQAVINGVQDLEFLSSAKLSEKAPSLSGESGLWSPSTGIIDSHQYMLSLLHIIEQNQGHYVPRTKFIAAQPNNNGFILTLETEGQQFELSCNQLINAGGLFASDNAKRIEGLSDSLIPEIHYCRGQYFTYHGSHPFKTLIYPVPEQHGLGIHATLDLSGRVKFGPDTHFINNLDYATDEQVKDKFISAIKRYWPALDETRLVIDYAGIRPKLNLDGSQDFVVQNENTHGIKGLINLFGIESPGLTASLAIAEYIAV